MIKLQIVDEMVRMYEEDNRSFLYIANYLMVDVKTVGTYLHKRGVAIRPAKGGRRKNGQKNSST